MYQAVGKSNESPLRNGLRSPKEQRRPPKAASERSPRPVSRRGREPLLSRDKRCPVSFTTNSHDVFYYNVLYYPYFIGEKIEGGYGDYKNLRHE